MAQEVQYLYGTDAGYDNLAHKDPMAFYKTPTRLFLGEWQLNNAAAIERALQFIGDLSNLNTSDKTCIVSAINEVLTSGGGGGGGVATDSTPGIVKLYNSVGLNTDGTMTQKAIQEELDKKAEVDDTVEDETLVINI